MSARKRPARARTPPLAIVLPADADGFFCCIRCCKPFRADPAVHPVCIECGAVVAVQDEIIDFVGGAATTELDTIDYDAKYGINEEHSLNLYHLLLRATGPLWPKDFGDALEIGCGTGGLSLALLSNISARHVVLTDISTKMLRQCRARLRAAGNQSAITFATYSGTEPCFRPGAFDTCFGTAVVHHITDVRSFLGQVHALLKPGGRAFFMEPNLSFHQALTATMADIVAELLRAESVPDTEISLMLNWTGEVHCNIVNSGDIEILAEREDKHQFVGGEFTAWAKAAGFPNATALPCDPDPTGWNTIQTYLDQCGINAATFAVLKKWWPEKHSVHFARLAVNDQSPSYLFWLRKPLHAPGLVPPAPPPAAVSPLPADPSPRTTLSFGLIRTGTKLEIHVSGWCFSRTLVRAVQLVTCGVTRRIPIWRPRPDVQKALNRDNACPPLHALCSGVEGSISLQTPSNTIEVAIGIVPVVGPVLPMRTVSLTVGETREIA